MSATINLKLWKYRAKQDGTFPIYIRITKNRKSSWLSTDVSVRERDWDDKKGKVKPSHPNSARLNALLQKTELKYQNEVLKVEEKALDIGTKSIKEKILGKDATNFLQVANELMDSYRAQGKIGTYDKCNSIINKLTDYINNGAFTFEDLDVKTLMRYRSYLLEECGNKNSTVNTNFKFIKTVFLYAQKMGYIPLTANPFININHLRVETERGFLSEDEIKSIEEAQLPDGYISKARTPFYFNTILEE